jgi:hypothetical protein
VAHDRIEKINGAATARGRRVGRQAHPSLSRFRAMRSVGVAAVYLGKSFAALTSPASGCATVAVVRRNLHRVRDDAH